MHCGRYAPSPTGRLHLGNLRTAVLAWLQARLCNGKFVLRIDDLDSARNQKGSLERIIADLCWIGLDWDEGPDIGGSHGPYLQSERIKHYEKAFGVLRSKGWVYPCQCSRKDIALSQSAPHQNRPTQVYPGTCRPNEKNRLGMKPPGEYLAWRFALENEVIDFRDNICGDQQQDLSVEVGDFVIKRREGIYAYQLASVVDDALMGITDVLRGEDLLDSTPRQILLMRKLNYSQPCFWHVPLMCGDDEKRLSKRDGSESLEQWQEQHKSPHQLIGHFACSLGFADNNQALSINELLQGIDLHTFKHNLSTR